MATTYRAVWVEGEIMHGWRGTHDLVAAGIARYMPGWGTEISGSIVRALVPGAPEHPREGDAVEFTDADVQRVQALLATQATQAAKRAKPRRVEFVKCDCGHVIPSTWVMSASRGSSCPRCYDRLSG